MAKSRLTLHDELCVILGTRYVYFQPPETVKLQYPCIIYERSNSDVRYADNSMYNKLRSYTVTVIDKDPDSELPDRIEELSMCRLDRFYTADNLNHWIFTLFYGN